MSDYPSQEYFQELDRLVEESLQRSKGMIGQQAWLDAQDFWEHGEYGLAIETMIFSASELELPLTRKLADQLCSAAEIMQLPESVGLLAKKLQSRSV
ncbi:MAG: MafI family immunity protein [Acidobacteriota bacterium]